MAKYVKINSTKEAVTFKEFVVIGKVLTTNIVNNMPWNFNYKGFTVTQESDIKYLLVKGDITIEFTPELVLVTDEQGTYPLVKDMFLNSYEEIN